MDKKREQENTLQKKPEKMDCYYILLLVFYSFCREIVTQTQAS